MPTRVQGGIVQAHVGDRIVIESNHLDAARRRGTIVAVLGGEGDTEHYRVRWQDGHESVFFPGPDAHVDTAR
ncbi:hypothetical protein GCM10017577_18430 [Pseudonocardia halophobica]|uniref:DUF1918 domain-containing protein n=1 Tax=Pseudonocardia halophobica TaxID=29401 RepID=A0A9W6KZU2_9PSEU|nr:hypothetical protein GCM10017577_18430 [Pseudonocardia halophobica]